MFLLWFCFVDGSNVNCSLFPCVSEENDTETSAREEQVYLIFAEHCQIAVNLSKNVDTDQAAENEQNNVNGSSVANMAKQEFKCFAQDFQQVHALRLDF